MKKIFILLQALILAGCNQVTNISDSSNKLEDSLNTLLSGCWISPRITFVIEGSSDTVYGSSEWCFLKESGLLWIPEENIGYPYRIVDSTIRVLSEGIEIYEIKFRSEDELYLAAFIADTSHPPAFYGWPHVLYREMQH